MAIDYTKTLNLPATDFSMRANLPQREPLMLEKWKQEHLYETVQQKNADKPAFILHDGPPFSNGNIHMGTAMNKILKDFINKYKSMTGYRTPYIPGWDNHGMPIESAIIKKNKLDRKKMSVPEFRQACHAFANDFVNIQREQFVRLGVLGDWEHPYLTMDPGFEAREVRVFGEMYQNQIIYKGLKPVYWCPHDETALAEAEIEYQEDACTAIYVKFRICDDLGKLEGIDLDHTYFVIWTTTTWTLPGNLAIALHPDAAYALVQTDGGDIYIIAEALTKKTMAAAGVDHFEILKTLPGSAFEFMKARHPFLDRDSLLVNADYVTMDSGTGCVHTAPGFGADDYITCRRYGMDIIVPVDDKGYQTAEAGAFAGMYYEESNSAILEEMKRSGALFAAEEITHTYPHCWRCKHPIIFRATPQWFCSVDAFKDAAVKACADVTWMPAWGGERMVQMIRERADWCISRQRHWGLPIPVFYCEDCGKPVCTSETIDAVSNLFAREGSNAWFEKEADAILAKDFVCPHCGGRKFTKETDTLDGWFDSGSTHFHVLSENSDMKWPSDLYLEGADQYRGWFQSSLLTAVAAGKGKAPYKSVLTHGWVVDGEGKAMHKSLGNSVLAEDVVKKYGADLLRLWVASADYQVDVRVSDQIFRQLSDAYRKIRNTARILLANLGTAESDFNPDTHLTALEGLEEIDKWLLTRLNRLIRTVRAAFDRYEFHIISHEISNFCTIELSKLYIDITKDRLYVERKDAATRRAVQSVMYLSLQALTRMLAPLLSFTAEEIWLAMPHSKEDDARSVFLNDMSAPCVSWEFPEIEARYDKLFELRDDVMKALELARTEKIIGKSLDADITLYASGEMYALLDECRDILFTVFIVSSTALREGPAPADCVVGEESGIGIAVNRAAGEKCDRCWMYHTGGKHIHTEDGEGYLCPRCQSVLEN